MVDTSIPSRYLIMSNSNNEENERDNQDIVGLIEETATAFDNVKREFYEIVHTEDDATAPTIASTVATSVKRIPSYEEIFQTLVNSFDDCFDSDDDDNDVVILDMKTYFRNSSPRSVFFDLESRHQDPEDLTIHSYETEDPSRNPQFFTFDTLLDDINSRTHTRQKHKTQKITCLLLRAHNLGLDKRNHGLTKCVHKQELSAYFEISYYDNHEQYRSSLPSPISKAEHHEGKNKRWHLLYRSYPLRKDSDLCWELSYISLPHDKDASSLNGRTIKISLFNITYYGRSTFIGSSLTTLEGIVSSLPAAKVLINKDRQRTGLITIHPSDINHC